MYARIAVPVDRSEMGWAAIGPARLLAGLLGAELELVSVVADDVEVDRARSDMNDHLAACGWKNETSVVVLVAGSRSVSEALTEHVNAPTDGTGSPNTLVVMTSHGRGRSAAILGSVAEQLLQALAGPILIVGPSADGDHLSLSGPMLVCVDGSDVSEQALDVAAGWVTGLDLEPWVIAVSKETHAVLSGDQIAESAYPHRLANRMAASVGRSVEFELLHGRDPAKAVAEFAAANNAQLIVATTHGRTGVDRLTGGSVAMELVRHSPCPVLLARVAASP